MAVTFADLTVDPQTLVDADPTSPVRIIVRTNTGGAIIDSAANKIFLGTYSVDTETTATISLPVTNGATNPTDFQYAVDLEYVDAATRTRKTWSSGWFSFTAAASLASIAAEQYVPPTWMTTAVATLQAKIDEGQALLDAQEEISGLTGEDAAVGALIEGTAGAGPITRAALSASIGVGAAAKIDSRRLHFLDAYNAFFNGAKFVTGQSNGQTSLTAAVAAGASVLPVANATNMLAGQTLVVAVGTSEQKLYTIVSVAGNDVTITGTTTYALANGAAVTPLWTNQDHLTTNGYKALAYFIANAKDSDGNYVIQGTAPKVTYLGNSWVFNPPAGTYTTQLTNRIPGATGVESGVGGNTSAMFLARFDTDVPADSDYVVFNEPGVNDDINDVSVATQLANLAELVRKIRAIGATPVYLGHAPLLAWARSLNAHTRTKAAIGDGTGFPGTAPGASFAAIGSTPDATSIGIGIGSLRAITTSLGGNTTLGVNAGAVLSTGAGVTLIGHQAGWQLTTGSNVTAVGQQALFSATTGNSSTAVGQLSGYSVTTGANNTLIGREAGYNPAGTGTANGLTTGGGNVFVGYRSGGAPTTANAVGVGNSAVASGTSSVALGALTTASHAGAVVIGRDSGGTSAASTAINDFILGTAMHQVKVAGRLWTAASTATQAGLIVPHGTAPTAPTDGAIWTDASGMYVRINGVTKTITLA